jgi:hypothetical protein
MSFNNGDILLNADENGFTYNLANVDIVQTDIQSLSSDKYYKIGFSNGITLDYIKPDGTRFTVSNKGTAIQFFSIIHDNIKGITDFNGQYYGKILAEMVISATGTTNSGTQNVYLCYLLVNVPNGSGTDDKNGSITNIFNKLIINSNGSFNYSDNANKNKQSSVIIDPLRDGTIPSINDCIIYLDDKGGLVIVFTNPITIGTNTKLITFLQSLKTTPDQLPTPLFSKYPTKGGEKNIYSKRKSNNTSTNNIPTTLSQSINNTLASISSSSSSSSSTTSNSSPNDQIYIKCSPTGDSIEKSTYAQVPFDSNLIQDIQNSSFAEFCQHFFFFAAIIIASWFGIPMIYKVAVLEKMEGTDQQYSIIFTLLYFAFIAFIIFSYGNFNEWIFAGFILFLGFLIFALTIGMDGSLENFTFDVTDFLTFISKVIGNFLIKTNVIAPIIVVIIIILLFISVLKNIKINNDYLLKDISHTMVMIITFLFIPFIVGLILWIFKK